MSKPRREKLTPYEDAPYRSSDPFFANGKPPTPIRASVDDRRAPAGDLNINSTEIHELHMKLKVFLTLEKVLMKDTADMGEREDRIELEVIERGLGSENAKVRRTAVRLLARRIQRIERRRERTLDRATQAVIANIRAEGEYPGGFADWPPFSVEPTAAQTEGRNAESLEDAR